MYSRLSQSFLILAVTTIALFSLTARAALEESDARAAKLLENSVKEAQAGPYRSVYNKAELGEGGVSGVRAASVPAGCVANPLPTTPGSPNYIIDADWTSSERAKATIWRQPCQNDPTKSAVLMRVVPTNEPFLCTVAFAVVKGGVQYDSVKITKTVGGESFCDDLFTPTTFLLDQWSIYTNFDENAAFQLIYDGFDYESSVNIPAYSYIEPVSPGDASRAGERVVVDGYVYFGSTPLCAMVIANGQSAFSCNPPGSIELPNVPLDSNGLVEVQIFASGFAPTKQKYAPTGPTSLQEYTSEGSGATVSIPQATMKRVENGNLIEVDVTYTESSIEGYVDITGTLTSNGTPVCALFLVNGTKTFTCFEKGKIYLQLVPMKLDSGTPKWTTQVFADGHKTYRKDHSMPTACSSIRNCEPGTCVPRCSPGDPCCTEGNGGTGGDGTGGGTGGGGTGGDGTGDGTADSARPLALLFDLVSHDFRHDQSSFPVVASAAAAVPSAWLSSFISRARITVMMRATSRRLARSDMVSST
jgi:hypothetical protein